MTGKSAMEWIKVQFLENSQGTIPYQTELEKQSNSKTHNQWENK